MSSLNLLLGERISLAPLLPDGSCSDQTYTSTIQDILSDTELLIAPISYRDLESFIGHEFKLTVARARESYVAAGKINGRTRQKNMFFFNVVILEDFVRVQRRGFYRLKISLGTEIWDYGKFSTVDLSGNGMTFKADVTPDIEFKQGEQIKGTLDLNGNAVPISGTVIRLRGVPEEKKTMVSVKFEGLNVKAQDKIVRFIHNQQFAMIKKGIL